MLLAENIVHRYGNETVLYGIDLQIMPKSFTVITGESGSGKSTLLSILSTLLSPSEGRVFLDGMERSAIRNIDTFRNQKIGFVFQFHYLIPHLTVYQNIAMVTKKPKEMIMAQLARLGVETLHARYPDQISGGQKQRIAIARAMINDPDYLFADEPTGNLDSVNSDTVFGILRESGTTVIVATHDISRIEEGDHVIRMKDGYLC